MRPLAESLYGTFQIPEKGHFLLFEKTAAQRHRGQGKFPPASVQECTFLLCLRSSPRGGEGLSILAGLLFVILGAISRPTRVLHDAPTVPENLRDGCIM